MREEKGFALIGVLVASAIGLIVISGLTQLFVNMGAQIKQLESRAGLRTFKSLIERSFQDSAVCKENLGHFLGDPADSSKAGLWNNAKKTTGAGTIDFDKVRDKDGNIIEDLSSSSLESDYGLSGHVTLQLKCETPPCDCSGHPTGWSGGKCEKDWSVRLISQRKIKGVHIFNKPELLSKVKVSFKDKDDRTDWECKGLLLPPSIGCLTLKGSGNERSLAGCGTTQAITKAGSEGTTTFGYNAGNAKTTGAGNTFLGHSAGNADTTGKENTFVGHSAGYSNTTGFNNTFVGYQAGYSNTTGGSYTKNPLGSNTFIGHSAGYSNTTGFGNTFVGYQAGKKTTTTIHNTFVGSNAGKNNESRWNTFVGSGAGYSNKTGGNNTFVGSGAGYRNTTGFMNTFIGQAGSSNTTGRDNTFVGYQAGYSNKIGQYNTFVGNSAGFSNTTGQQNIFVGNSAGLANTTGKENTFVGMRAGSVNKEGKRNTFIGYYTGYRSTTGDENIIIGYYAGSDVTTQDDRLRIGNNKSRNWISGTIGTTGNNTDLRVAGAKVCLANRNIPGCGSHPHSSRTLKKNIKPYNHFTDRLKDIIKTPLFTYEFKDKDRHPEKSRMGIISEELPDRLKLKIKGEPPIPDWLSIYGTFWASIKALWDMIQTLEKDRVQKIEKELADIKERLKEIEGKETLCLMQSVIL